MAAPVTWVLCAMVAVATASASVSASGCSASNDASPSAPSPTEDSTLDAGADAILPRRAPNVFDVPVEHATAEERTAFTTGDNLFDLPLRDADGLGPLYTRTSCGACHSSGARGPGLVQKMEIVLADGVTPASDQSALPFGHTVHPLCTAGGKEPIVPPLDAGASVKVTTRVGPSVLGRGYLEAILDSEIVRVAAEQAVRSDGIHGRVNHVVYQSEPNPDQRFHQHRKGDVIIGRFGLKARIATIDDFTADALQGDMGITSPLRPVEFANPDGLTDDLKPGVDVTIDSVNLRATYVRLVAIPDREDVPRGLAIFNQVKCGACHVPSMKTRSDYPISALAGIDAPVYSDLLLHDMGDTLADGIEDGEAGSRDWRTPPLIGLRFERSYLHDSRASSIEEAIVQHAGPGSEATESLLLFHGLSDADRTVLLRFVGSL